MENLVAMTISMISQAENEQSDGPSGSKSCCAALSRRSHILTVCLSFYLSVQSGCVCVCAVRVCVCLCSQGVCVCVRSGYVCVSVSAVRVCVCVCLGCRVRVGVCGCLGCADRVSVC